VVVVVVYYDDDDDDDKDNGFDVDTNSQCHWQDTRFKIVTAYVIHMFTLCTQIKIFSILSLFRLIDSLLAEKHYPLFGPHHFRVFFLLKEIASQKS
jgi:hypothetical protein